MGVGDHGILAVGSDLESTALEAVAAMVSDESELISIYYGEEMTEDDAQKLADALSEEKPEGIKLVAVHSFDYYIFDTEELRCADLYIVGENKAEKYIASFRPLAETGFAAEGETWQHEGMAF